MSTAEVIKYIADYLYFNAGASSKKAALASATHIVNQLIDAGVLTTTDATPS